MTTAVLVYNPAAGRFSLSEKRLKLLLENLDRYGIRGEAAMTRPSQDPSTWLNLKDTDLLIVYGGDGTLHGVIGQAVKWKVPVALLPAGTTNVLARELGIPRDPEQALSLVERRKLQKIHLGKSNGKYFHLMAGIGFDGYVISQMNQPVKKILGIGAYWLAAAAAVLRYPFPPFELKMEGEVHQGTFAVIGNTRYYGGEFLVTPRASVKESCLDVCLFTGRRRWRYLSYFLGVLSGKHLRYHDVIYRKVQRVEVLSDNSVPIQMDGELIGHGPMEFVSSSESLEVVVP